MYETTGGLGRLGSDGTASTPEGGPGRSITFTSDGSVLRVASRELTRWWPDGSSVIVECRCIGAVEVDDGVFGVGRDGRLHRFGPDLTLIDVVETDLSAQVAAGEVDDLGLIAGAATGEIRVSGVQTDNPASMAGGPFSIWALDTAGAARLVLAVEANVRNGHYALSPDGGSLVFSTGIRLGPCAHSETLTTVDLVTGVTTTLPPIWEPTVEPPPQQELLVTNPIWTTDGIYTIGWVTQGDASGEGDCDARWPAALWRFDGTAWEIADSGPVAQLAPIDPSTKAYLITDELGTAGDLYWERDGEASVIATSSRIVAFSPAQVDVGLVPPPRLSPAAAATVASLLAAAASGSNLNVGEAAGDGFAFSFDSEPDPVAYWDDLEACCDIVVSQIVDRLLRQAPVLIDSLDGRTLYVWSEPIGTAWRIAIDQNGNVAAIISGEAPNDS